MKEKIKLIVVLLLIIVVAVFFIFKSKFLPMTYYIMK